MSKLGEKIRNLRIVLSDLISNQKIKGSSDKYVKYLRSKGVKVGNNVAIHSQSAYIDMACPFLITIGDNVLISRNLNIYVHDYANFVAKNEYSLHQGSLGKVTIGNNVYIGVNVTLLKGADIGNNVIIAANSMVSCKIPDNEVWGGIPARKICTVEEYIIKREKKQIEELKELIIAYYNRYDKKPTIEDFPHYEWLVDKDKNNITSDNYVINNMIKERAELLDNFSFEKFVDEIVGEG